MVSFHRAAERVCTCGLLGNAVVREQNIWYDFVPQTAELPNVFAQHLLQGTLKRSTKLSV